jgi:hypothetical protein
MNVIFFVKVNIIVVSLMYFIQRAPSNATHNLITKLLIYVSTFNLSSYVPNQVLPRERK